MPQVRGEYVTAITHDWPGPRMVNEAGSDTFEAHAGDIESGESRSQGQLGRVGADRQGSEMHGQVGEVARQERKTAQPLTNLEVGGVIGQGWVERVGFVAAVGDLQIDGARAVHDYLGKVDRFKVKDQVGRVLVPDA
jgi:hypothetical protein